MFKKYCLILLFCISTSTNVFASSMKLRLSEIANTFHILDQVSQSLPDFFTVTEYKDLEKHFDLKMLGKYKKIRNKYQTIPIEYITGEYTGNLFPSNPTDLKDPIFDAFFTSNTLNDALSKIEKLVTNEELKFLRDFFQDNAEILKTIDSTANVGLQKNLYLLNSNINEEQISQHLDQVRAFYQSPKRELKSILLIWSPSNSGFSGQAYGDHLVVRTSSKEIPNEEIAKMLVSVIVHEATHHVSSNVSMQHKKELSKAFTNISNIDELPHFLFAIEEPLVIATQMHFVKKYFPSIYEKNMDWFNHPMAIKIFPILQEYFNSKNPIDIDFMVKSANIFNALQESSY